MRYTVATSGGGPRSMVDHAGKEGRRPVNASIHKVDEHIRLADLDRMPALYLAVIHKLLATD